MDLDTNLRHQLINNKRHQRKYLILTLIILSVITLGCILIRWQKPYWDSINITLLVVLGALWLSYIIWLLYHYCHLLQTLNAIAATIQKNRHNDKTAPMLVEPHNVLAPLITEINHLNENREALQEKVSLRQASFNGLIDHLPSGVMVISSDRDIVLHNESLVGMLGRTKITDGCPYIDVVKTYALSRMIEHTFRHHKSHHKEIQLVQGNESYVDANVVELQTPRGKQQVLVILYDLTSIRRVEQMQLDFVSNVSHELKTPVTAINGFAETLLDGAKDDPQTNEQFIKIIFDESKRLEQLIQDILALSRLDNNRDNSVKQIQVLDLIQEAQKLLAQQIAKRHITVHLDVPATATITTDPVKFDQIVKNLLANAIFYNHENGQVWVRWHDDGNQVTLQVQDTGIGIAEDMQKRIFERFYRVDPSRSKNSGGTGLGLSIVKEITESLGGQVSLQSQLGVGSTFTITLPKTETNISK